MSEFPAGTPRDAPRRPCRRTRPEAYRCACGRLRDRCVRAAVRALWTPSRRTPAARVTPTEPARP
ncbi:hypothetical protein GA0070606_1963 [Micromonospora citrea]|uniref:Uncharacterized protein n=1 Tax=Micromonospora citrea TaxID=47855 RepID=A0A1C6UEL9_9ACTN|nr:hypothetical protein GA0070606_1963 [Micromonospora citrea]